MVLFLSSSKLFNDEIISGIEVVEIKTRFEYIMQSVRLGFQNLTGRVIIAQEDLVII